MNSINTEIIEQYKREHEFVPVPQIVDALKSLSTLLQKYVQVGALSIDEEKFFVNFVVNYRDTNNLVIQALSTLPQEPSRCLAEFSSLHEASVFFLSYCESNKEKIQSIDLQADCERYLAPFEKQYDESKSEAAASWKLYQDASNRLDYLDERADNYEDLVKDLNEKETRYKEIHAQTEKIYSSLREKKEYIAAIYLFSFDMLFILVDKIKQISLSVIFDVNNIEKGGRL